MTTSLISSLASGSKTVPSSAGASPRSVMPDDDTTTEFAHILASQFALSYTVRPATDNPTNVKTAATPLHAMADRNTSLLTTAVTDGQLHEADHKAPNIASTVNGKEWLPGPHLHVSPNDMRVTPGLHQTDDRSVQPSRPAMTALLNQSIDDDGLHRSGTDAGQLTEAPEFTTSMTDIIRNSQSSLGTNPSQTRSQPRLSGSLPAGVHAPTFHAATLSTSHVVAHSTDSPEPDLFIKADVPLSGNPNLQTQFSTNPHTDSPAGTGMPVLPAFNLTTTSVAGEALPLNASISNTLYSPQWAPDFNHQFASLVRRMDAGSHRVELRLDPPELGPLRITININDSVVHAMFTSPHSAVRHAVEHALPQLQQQLEQEGLSLGQTHVDQGDAWASPHTNDPGNDAHTPARQPGEKAITSVQQPPRQQANHSLVDTFA